MTSRSGKGSDMGWPWRRLVGIGVVATLVMGGLHFLGQRRLRGTSSLLDHLSILRAAVDHGVPVAETTPSNVSVPMQPVVDLQRMTPQIARLRPAGLPEPTGSSSMSSSTAWPCSSSNCWAAA